MTSPVHRTAPQPVSGRASFPNEPDLVHASVAMRDLIDAATRAGACDAKVVITGESGVGKELVARHIHTHSPRAHGPYVAVNCAGVPETLLETELFGHVRGSFTDANRDHLGRLRLANSGTLFLDEVGEMSLRMQALLLRFLDTGEVQPVGSDRLIAHTDVRVIAATNRNLDERVDEGVFRRDLLFRLRVIHLHVPALRDRPDDVPLLARHFLAAHDRSLELGDDAIAVLAAYDWPGNVRQLRNVIEHVAALADGDRVGADALPADLRTRVTSLGVKRERRRQLADDLFEGILSGRRSFWADVHDPFLDRDLTRHDVRAIISRGLAMTCGNYHALLGLFRLPANDYKRLLNFLATHDCSVDVRPFRSAPGERPH